MFFTCIFLPSAVQPVSLIQLSGKPAGNFLFLLTGSSSSCFKNFLGPFIRDRQHVCIFSRGWWWLQGGLLKIKTSVCPCFMPNWRMTQRAQSKWVMTRSLVLSKTAFRGTQLTHWREAIIALREALVSKTYKYVSTDKRVAYATVFRPHRILMRSRYQRPQSFP